MKRTVLAAVVLFMIFGFLSAAKAESNRYIVKPGDSLSKIAIRENIGSWQEIASLNNISNPYVIHPGQKLVLPGGDSEKTDESGRVYTVKKGDWLSKIANENGVNNWRDIADANGIKAPDYVIQVGQKLNLPENGDWVWQNHGADPWGDRGYIKAIGSFRKMPDDVKISFLKIVNEGDFEWGMLRNGDRRVEMVTGTGGVKQNVVVGGPDNMKAEATRRYTLERDGWLYTLEEPIICHNWAWTMEEIQVPVTVSTAAEKASQEIGMFGKIYVSIVNNDDDIIFVDFSHPEITFARVRVEALGNMKFGVPQVVPGEHTITMSWTDPDTGGTVYTKDRTGTVVAGEETTFEFIIDAHQAALPPVPVHPGHADDRNMCSLTVGAGIYTSDDDDHTGYYGWGKARCRPFEFIVNSFKVRVGLFAFGALGEGDDEGYDYDWQEYAIGPSGQLVGYNWDLDLDLGIGKLWNEGEINTYESEQEDNIFLVSSHLNHYGRRSMKELWFPAGEANLEWRIPYGDPNHHHSDNGIKLASDPYDNQYLEVDYQQDIYDFHSDTENWVTTPNVQLGGGHDWGLPADFWKAALGLDFRYKDLKFAGVKAGYKEFLEEPGDQWFVQGMLNWEF